jgi:hypothetical protein
MTAIDNKNWQDIHQDLLKEHKNHESGKRYNQEVLATANAVVQKIQTPLNTIAMQIKSFANPEQKQLYVSKWADLNKKIKETTKWLNTWSYMTKHEETMKDIAHKIDNTENNVIELIQDVQNIKEVTEDEQAVHTAIDAIQTANNVSYFEKGEGGIITLTQWVNQPRIDQVLWDLIVEGKVWKIDYSNCSNASIKSRMESAVGWSESYITKGLDKDGKSTFVLLNAKGEKLDQRALIWEGVKLTPDATLRKSAVEELQREKKVVSVPTLTESDKSNLIQSIPPWLRDKLATVWVSSFIDASEKILDDVLLDAKQHGRELQTDAISKLWFSGWVGELHLIDGSSTKNVILFTKKNTDPALYQILDKNEDDLLKYLSVRVQEKWQQMSHLTKRSNILSNNPEWEIVSKEQKENTLYGLSMMDQMMNSIIQSEWYTWGKTDIQLRAIKDYIQDALYSIQNGNPTKQDLANIQLWLSKRFASWMNVFDNKLLTNIIQWSKKEDVIAAVRKLWETTTVFANAHTTFLREEIDDNIQIKNIEYNTYFNNIAQKFALNEEDPTKTPESVKDTIDNLYDIVSRSWSGHVEVLNYFKQLWLLPASADIQDDAIVQWCKKIYDTIQHREKMLASMSMPTAESIKQWLRQERLFLEQQKNKSADDISRLQTLLFIEQNPSAIDDMVEQQVANMQEVLKYGWLDDVIRWALSPWLVKKWWWAIGKNADIYNDSVGAGWRLDWSDENAARAVEITKVMAQEIAIALVAIGAWMVTGWAATAWIYGARIAAASGRVIQIGARAKTFRLLLNLNKAKQLHNIGKLRMLKDAERVSTLSKWGKAKSILSPSIHGSVGTMISWLTYATTTTTLKNQWDYMTPEKFGGELLQGASMIGILNIAGKLFPWKNFGSFIKRIFTEETGINIADFWKITYLDGGVYTMQEFAQNMLLWFLFEGVFRYAWPALKSIKSRIKSDGVEKVLSQELAIPKNREALSKIIDQSEGAVSKNPELIKYYDILWVKEWASREEIKKAYRDLAKIYHPDIWWDPVKFKEVAEAYAIIDKQIKLKTPKTTEQLKIEEVKVEGSKSWEKSTNDAEISGKKVEEPQNTNTKIDNSKSIKESADAFKNMSAEEARKILQELPNNIDNAIKKMELLWWWLERNIAWPWLQLVSDMRKRVKSIELKFPTIKISQQFKDLREKIIDTLRKASDQRLLKFIKKMEKVPDLQKVKFMDRIVGKIRFYSEAELVAIYKMMWGKSDPWDRVRDSNYPFKEKIASDIKDLHKKMKKDLDARIKKEFTPSETDIRFVKHNFEKTPILELSKSQIELNFSSNTSYNIYTGKTAFILQKEWSAYRLVQEKTGASIIIKPGEEITLGRSHNPNNKFILDDEMSRAHMSIKVDDTGNVIVKDLASTNKTNITRSIENKNTATTRPPENISSKFEQVKSFDELYRELDRISAVNSETTKKTYTAQELKTTIDNVRSWKISINYIPMEFWLRNKVEGLIKLENKYNWKGFKSKESRDLWKEDIDMPIVKEYNWIWTEAEKLLDRGYVRKPRQIRLYNEFVDPPWIKKFDFSDGSKWEYKLHISANESNFDVIMKEFGDFFVQQEIWAKCAPWKQVATPEMWEQYWKVFTVYAKDKAEMLKVVNKAKELYAKWFWWIEKSEFVANNSNLQYEMPIQWTGNLVYYTIDSFADKWLWNLGYLRNYSERLNLMNKYKWQWPLDEMVDWSSVNIYQ